MKTFDILVYSDGADGKQHQSTVNGVKAESKRELMELYAMTGEKIQIIRETDDGEPPKAASVCAAKAAEQEAATADTKKKAVAAKQAQQLKKEQPKFFKVGDVECKYDNGKVYQKQWLKLSQSDCANYRIISDVNNKIVPFTGKHLEKLTWVCMEDLEHECSQEENA